MPRERIFERMLKLWKNAVPHTGRDSRGGGRHSPGICQSDATGTHVKALVGADH